MQCRGFASFTLSTLGDGGRTGVKAGSELLRGSGCEGADGGGNPHDGDGASAVAEHDTEEEDEDAAEEEGQAAKLIPSTDEFDFNNPPNVRTGRPFAFSGPRRAEEELAGS